MTALTPKRLVPFAAQSLEEPVPYSLPAIIVRGVPSSLYFDGSYLVEESVEDCDREDHFDEFAIFFQGTVGGHQCGTQFVAPHDYHQYDILST